MTTFDRKLIRLRPRPQTLYVSCGETVLALGRDGFIHGGPDQGLFVDETRLLSRYCCTVDDQPLFPVAVSNVSQRSCSVGSSRLARPRPTPGSIDSPRPHVAD
jgi:hypothetical protein